MSAHSCPIQLHARVAGFLYLVIILLGIWSEVAVRSTLIVEGDAAATASNILGSEGLFRLSIAADSVMAIADGLLAVLLFFLLRPISPLLAMMAMVFRLLQTGIIGMNLLHQDAALLTLLTQGSDQGLATAQLEMLAAFWAKLHGHGYDFGLIFFGVNSLLTGYLVWCSSFVPKVIGGLIMLAGCVYLTGSYLVILAPDISPLFQPAYLVPLVAESAFCLWLLIRGVGENHPGFKAP